MTGAEHFIAAEALLASLDTSPDFRLTHGTRVAAEAQAHASLAAVALEVDKVAGGSEFVAHLDQWQRVTA